MKSYLKVKIKSLAAEARIIRAEERRALKASRWAHEHQVAGDTHAAEFQGLHGHRTGPVRSEARYAQLAYGYLRGRPYRVIENRGVLAGWECGRVAALAAKYGGLGKDDAVKAITTWAA